ncbi:hypothetical protein F5I97DRAFT_1861056 [Phlebopus sp. FC_14]|nr:hypothetical protein F5I97DRAFT_1861056 [Phlebopus sp. FC_14]
MIEPLAAAIVNGVRPRTTTTSTPILRSAFGAMGRPTHRSLPQDFFTPHPRPWKGKEKAPDPCTVDCLQCTTTPVDPTTSSCVAKHSLWCPKRNRLFMMNQVIPRRLRSPRQVGSQKCTGRHTSSSAPRLNSSSPRLVDPPSVVSTPRRGSSEHLPRFDLHSILRTNSRFDPNHALSSYETALRENPDEPPFSPSQRLVFVRKLLAAMEPPQKKPPDLTRLRKWGLGIRLILQTLESSFERYSVEDVTRLCLRVQAYAMSGGLDEAARLAREISHIPLSVKEKDIFLGVYRNLLFLMHAHKGSVPLLETMALDWSFLALHLESGNNSRKGPADLQFRDPVLKIVAETRKPDELLYSNWISDKGIRQRVGELLLQAYCQESLAHEAHAVLTEMRTQRLPVRHHLQMTLVRLLAKEDLFVQANTLFPLLSPPGPSRQHYSTGLYLYARQGDVAHAEQFFKALEDKKWVAYIDQCMLMHTYAVAKQPQMVVDLFHKFFPGDVEDMAPRKRPGILPFTTVIFAHAERGDFDGLNSWLEAMLRAGYNPDSHVYNIILRSFASRGEVDAVASILDQMRAAGLQPTHVHYTSVIVLLAQKRDPVAAEAIYKQALREGIVPDRRMITALMNAHVESGSWAGVIRIFDYLKGCDQRRVALSIEVYNTLLKAYVLIGAPFRVVSTLFWQLPRSGIRPDGHTYALVIQSACDAGMMNIARDIFADMESKSEDWPAYQRYDAFALTIIMAGHLRLGQKAEAKAVYDDMQRRGIQPNSVTFRQILQAHGNERNEESLQIAEEFLESIMNADSQNRSWMDSQTRQSALEDLYSPVMQAYVAQHKPEDVERLFESMLEAGGEPSLETLTILLDVYRRTANFEAVQKVWPQIWQIALRLSSVDDLFKAAPSDAPPNRQSNVLCIPLSVYIDILSATGRHHTISEVWAEARSRGFSFDSHNWNHLAVALVRAGELDHAFEVIERVILPYQRQSQIITDSRDRHPDSPLSFDTSPPDPDDRASEAPMHRLKRRAAAVKLSTKKAGDMLDEATGSGDFVHPLHILHQIIPSWNMWRPHTATLEVLARVLRHLQGGRTVQPVRPPGVPGKQLDVNAHAKIASGALARIYDKYPQAVRAVTLYERQKSREDAVRRRDDGWS